MNTTTEIFISVNILAAILNVAIFVATIRRKYWERRRDEALGGEFVTVDDYWERRRRKTPKYYVRTVWTWHAMLVGPAEILDGVVNLLTFGKVTPGWAAWAAEVTFRASVRKRIVRTP